MKQLYSFAIPAPVGTQEPPYIILMLSIKIEYSITCIVLTIAHMLIVH